MGHGRLCLPTTALWSPPPRPAPASAAAPASHRASGTMEEADPQILGNAPKQGTWYAWHCVVTGPLLQAGAYCEPQLPQSRGKAGQREGALHTHEPVSLLRSKGSPAS